MMLLKKKKKVCEDIYDMDTLKPLPFWTRMFIIIFCSFALGVFLTYLAMDASGQDLNPQEFYLHADEGMSIEQKLTMIPDGSTLKLEGIFYSGLSFKKATYHKGITVDGQSKTILFGYNGTYDPIEKTITLLGPDGLMHTVPFNPATMYQIRNWGGISIMDSHNVTIKNLEVWGSAHGLDLNDSYPEIGLKNILIKNCTFQYCGMGVFSGGYAADNITLQNCKIREICYGGQTTHAIYFSGGHWDKFAHLPGWTNIRILGCTVEYSGGRHLIQFNGRFTNVEVRNCTLRHAQLSGISSIGVQNGIYRNNTIHGCNRQGIVIFEDGADDIDWSNPGHVSWWLSHHQPNQNILIDRNTIIVGPKQWKYDEWRNDSPEGHAAILINNPVNALCDGKFPTKGIYITNNVIHSPNESFISIYHDYEAANTYLIGNMFGTSKENATPGISSEGKFYPLKDVEKHFPEQVWLNEYEEDFKFRKFPEYPDSINTSIQWDYWFGMSHGSKADLFSAKTHNKKKGAYRGPPRIEGPVYHKEKLKKKERSLKTDG
jgi:hypothetical protein